jgi:hypothetical protein
MSLHYKLFFLLLLLIVNTPRIEAQVIWRLAEAEFSAFMNTGALIAIEKAEVKANKKMGLLNMELKKKTLYYNSFAFAKTLFPIKKTIERIELRLDTLDKINERIPQLFNWQKKNKTRKLKMYRNYLNSLKKDVLDYDYFSNNGNLLKIVFEIISELEEVEKEIDVTWDNLTFLESIPNLFNK